MKKIKLIYNELDYSTFRMGCIQPIVEQVFDFVQWDPAINYGSGHAVLTTFQTDFDPNAWFRPLMNQGIRVIVDHLWDSDVDTPSRNLGQKLDLRSGHWSWYSTALRAHDDGFREYRPQRNLTHDFLMLMYKLRDHRDRITQELAHELQTARWSYVERGRFIGDPLERETGIYWPFYMNPQWYDSTRFSVVVESWMRGDAWYVSHSYPNYKTEVSEKVYKPLAWFHPFIVMGSADTLQFLQRQGFETFSELWDESYDTITGDNDRFNAVVSLVRDVVKQHNSKSTSFDSITEEKLKHNHHRFFDIPLISQRVRDEILTDVEAFLS